MKGGYALQIVDTNGDIVIHGIELAREETLNMIVRAVNDADAVAEANAGSTTHHHCGRCGAFHGNRVDACPKWSQP